MYIYIYIVFNVYIYIYLIIIVKGSLDEKLPSYELLKMLKNHFSKVTDQYSNSQVK